MKLPKKVLVIALWRLLVALESEEFLHGVFVFGMIRASLDAHGFRSGFLTSLKLMERILQLAVSIKKS